MRHEGNGAGTRRRASRQHLSGILRGPWRLGPTSSAQKARGFTELDRLLLLDLLLIAAVVVALVWIENG